MEFNGELNMKSDFIDIDIGYDYIKLNFSHSLMYKNHTIEEIKMSVENTFAGMIENHNLVFSINSSERKELLIVGEKEDLFKALVNLKAYFRLAIW